jgi:hypothetical protein
MQGGRKGSRPLSAKGHRGGAAFDALARSESGASDGFEAALREQRLRAALEFHCKIAVPAPQCQRQRYLSIISSVMPRSRKTSTGRDGKRARSPNANPPSSTCLSSGHSTPTLGCSNPSAFTTVSPLFFWNSAHSYPRGTRRLRPRFVYPVNTTLMRHHDLYGLTFAAGGDAEEFD